MTLALAKVFEYPLSPVQHGLTVRAYVDGAVRSERDDGGRKLGASGTPREPPNGRVQHET